MKTTEELARDAGIEIDPRWGLISTGNVKLERFRQLVRNDALEEAAVKCREHGPGQMAIVEYTLLEAAHAIRALKK